MCGPEERGSRRGWGEALEGISVGVNNGEGMQDAGMVVASWRDTDAQMTAGKRLPRKNRAKYVMSFFAFNHGTIVQIDLK